MYRRPPPAESFSRSQTSCPLSGARTIKATCLSLYESFVVQRNMAERTNKAALGYLEKVSVPRGVLTANKFTDYHVTDENGASKTIAVPRMFCGSQRLGDNAIVEEVQTRFGGFAAVFQLEKGDLIPLSDIPQLHVSGSENLLYAPGNSPRFQRMMDADTPLHLETFNGKNLPCRVQDLRTHGRRR